jgi:hypothetical protein
MDMNIRDKVNILLEEHYLVLINKQYGGFSLSKEAINMILSKFPNIPDLKSREVHEYNPDFDFEFWNEKVRTNQDIVKFLLNFILENENIYIGIETLSGNFCSLDIVFVPTIDGNPIPYRIEEFDGVEELVPNINKDNIIEELCAHIYRLNYNQDGGAAAGAAAAAASAAAADNIQHLSFYTKIVLQYGTMPSFMKNKSITLKKLFIEEKRVAMNMMNQRYGFMPNIANMRIRDENPDNVVDEDGVIEVEVDEIDVDGNGVIGVDNNDADNNDAGDSDN